MEIKIDKAENPNSLVGKDVGFGAWKNYINAELTKGDKGAYKNYGLPSDKADCDGLLEKFSLISAEIQRCASDSFSTTEGRKYIKREAGSEVGARSFRVIQMLDREEYKVNKEEIIR